MARRITHSSINWTSFAERVPPDQKVKFAAFKVKSDGYLRRVLANPPEPPKINWAAYKQSIAVPGMVDTFQKQYEALKIPYPVDNMTAKVEGQWGEIQKSIEEFVKASNANITIYQKEIDKLKALLPFDQMTMEDFKDAFPDQALDPINRPTYWPHTDEEQPGYVDPNAQQPQAHQ